MMGKIQSLKKSIDRIANDLRKESKLIVLGDLNTMGLFFPTRHNYNRKVTQEEEISAIQKDAENQDMSILFKELSTTWTNGNKESDLDHIIASTNIHFNQFGQRENKPFFVKVTGWAQLAGQAKTNFVENISDHCSLYCEII